MDLKLEDFICLDVCLSVFGHTKFYADWLLELVSFCRQTPK